MIRADLIGGNLKRLGFNFYSGVPCSFQSSLINYAIKNCDYFAATNEGDAVAICAGAYLGGKKSVVLMQNSGLANAVSPLTSLNYVFKIPVLGFVSLRGEESINDEPQHELMGKITLDLLRLMKIKWDFLSDNEELIKNQIECASKVIDSGESFFFVVQKDTFYKDDYLNNCNFYPQFNNKIDIENSDDDRNLLSRSSCLKIISNNVDENTLILSTTGYLSRELYEISDCDNNFYMVGSMGCVSSIGLGLSLAREDKKVIVIDGDGSLLMRMGSMATIAHYKSKILHILMDNNSYESTGCQSTVSNSVNFVGLANSLGYSCVKKVDTKKNLDNFIREWKNNNQLTFLDLKIEISSNKKLVRPKIKPWEVKERFMKYIKND